MTSNKKLLQQHLGRIKIRYEKEIKADGGNTGFLIRSGKIIGELHEYVKKELIRNKVNKNYIFPALGKTSPEKVIHGYFKSKDQDIVVQKTEDNPLISINIRSQLSSIQKNYDTLFERLVAEAINLHEKYPKLTCGYLYLLPTVGYDAETMKENRVARNEHFNWEKYLTTFSLLADRKYETDKSFKYEKICLLAVDFSTDPPSIINSTKDFFDRGLIGKEFAKKFDYRPLSIDNLVEKLVTIFNQRNKIIISKI